MKKLQEIRKDNGLSQKQLAEKSGVKVGVLQMYEGGFRDINGASLKTILKLCIALNCKISDIIDDKDILEMCNKMEI